ncbi:hypothetical protein SDC9_129514 [bioreactor metagenome]|uniref:Uncharacterized protein n=1 Tax=bioreactor metagenome TaxID=1076179 RepID=A0A645D023_9ZZZZ
MTAQYSLNAVLLLVCFPNIVYYKKKRKNSLKTAVLTQNSRNDIKFLRFAHFFQRRPAEFPAVAHIEVMGVVPAAELSHLLDLVFALAEQPPGGFQSVIAQIGQRSAVVNFPEYLLHVVGRQSGGGGDFRHGQVAAVIVFVDIIADDFHRFVHDPVIALFQKERQGRNYARHDQLEVAGVGEFPAAEGVQRRQRFAQTDAVAFNPAVQRNHDIGGLAAQIVEHVHVETHRDMGGVFVLEQSRMGHARRREPDFAQGLVVDARGVEHAEKQPDFEQFVTMAAAGRVRFVGAVGDP